MTPWELAKSGSEHSEQRALFAWANMAERYGFAIANDPNAYVANGIKVNLDHKPLPQLRWLHAIHNQGHGDAIRGGKAKAEGVKPGVFDIFLPVLMRYKKGLYLEMKKANGKITDLSKEQREFYNDMINAGYSCEVGFGWLDAKFKILRYLEIV